MRAEELSPDHSFSHHSGKTSVLSSLQSDVLSSSPFERTAHADVADPALDALRPLLLDLIAMYHDLGRLIDDSVKRSMSASVQLMVENIESFQETIEEILCRYGIETFCVEGNTFLASQQRIVRVIETADRRLDKQIARRVRKGFKYEEKVLSPEVVMVYKAQSEA